MKLQSKIMILSIIAAVVVLGYLFVGLDQDIWQYALTKRVPKLLAIIITGGAIAIATLLFQTITNNRVLTPNVLGLDSIYVFVQTMIVFLVSQTVHKMPSVQMRFLISIACMIVFSLILYRLMFTQKQNIYLLLLVGMVLGTFFSSATGFIQKILDPNEFSLLQGKLFASFNNVQSELLILTIIIFLLTIPFIYDYVSQLDILMLGKDQAVNLGIDYEKITKKIFIIVTVLISVATALVGPLSFLGLMVVNLSYEICKTYRHKMLGLVAVLVSIIALVGGQFVLERVFNFNITLSVIINFVGGIYFIYLLSKEYK